jgi:hypothetical protein
MLAQVDGYSCSVLIVNPTDGNPYVRIVTPTKDWRVDVEAIDQGVNMTYPKSNSDLDKRVEHTMRMYHFGYRNRIARDSLAVEIYGRECLEYDDNGRETVNANYDRKLRDALSELPVIWQDGYFIPATRREAEGYLGRERKKAVSILQRVRSVEHHLRTQGERATYIQEKLVEV